MGSRLATFAAFRSFLSVVQPRAMALPPVVVGLVVAMTPLAQRSRSAALKLIYTPGRSSIAQTVIFRASGDGDLTRSRAWQHWDPRLKQQLLGLGRFTTADDLECCGVEGRRPATAFAALMGWISGSGHLRGWRFDDGRPANIRRAKPECLTTAIVLENIQR